MTRPTKHPKYGVYRVRVVVPPPLRDIIHRDHGRRAELVESLHTKDVARAKHRAPAVVEKFSAWLHAAEMERSGNFVSLTDAQVSALCGRWLANQQHAYAADNGNPAAVWDVVANEFGDELSMAERDGRERDPRPVAKDVAALLSAAG